MGVALLKLRQRARSSKRAHPRLEEGVFVTDTYRMNSPASIRLDFEAERGELLSSTPFLNSLHSKCAKEIQFMFGLANTYELIREMEMPVCTVNSTKTAEGTIASARGNEVRG